jgi:hypothetical protein
MAAVAAGVTMTQTVLVALEVKELLELFGAQTVRIRLLTPVMCNSISQRRCF